MRALPRRAVTRFMYYDGGPSGVGRAPVVVVACKNKSALDTPGFCRRRAGGFAPALPGGPESLDVQCGPCVVCRDGELGQPGHRAICADYATLAGSLSRAQSRKAFQVSRSRILSAFTSARHVRAITLSRSHVESSLIRSGGRPCLPAQRTRSSDPCGLFLTLRLVVDVTTSSSGTATPVSAHDRVDATRRGRKLPVAPATERDAPAPAQP